MSAALSWNPAPVRSFRTLGEIPSSGWDAYLLAVRDQAKSSMTELVTAYRTLRSIREGLGLPLLASNASEATITGALAPQDETRILELGAVVFVAGKAIDDAVAGKRRVAFSSDDEVSIESLPTDTAIVSSSGADVFVVDPKTGQRVQTSGTINGTLGIIPIGIAALVAAGVVVTVAAVWVAVKAIEVLKTAVQEKTTQTLSNNATKLVESGKATPEQATQMNSALLQAQTELAKARTEETKGSTTEVLSTVKTVAIVAAVITGLYFAARIIPEIIPHRATAAA